MQNPALNFHLVCYIKRYRVGKQIVKLSCSSENHGLNFFSEIPGRHFLTLLCSTCAQTIYYICAFQFFTPAPHLRYFENLTRALACDEKGESMRQSLFLYSMIIRNIFQITQRTLPFLLQSKFRINCFALNGRMLILFLTFMLLIELMKAQL